MKKKILFAINTLGHAGAEMAMLELMKQFDGNQYEISLYVLMEQGELVHQIPQGVKLLNKRYNDVSVLSKVGYKNMLKTLCKAAIKNANIFRLIPYCIKATFSMLKNHHFKTEKLLWRLVSEGAIPPHEDYDLAIAYLEGGSAYFVADHVKAKQKAAFIHIDYKKAGYTRILDLECYLKYQKIFTVSDEVKTHFLEVYPDCESKTHVFHNFIDQDKIRQRSKEPGGFKDSFDGIRLLTVGRLTHQKAYDIAIDSMKVLRLHGINARWYILGEGPLRPMLEKKIAKENLGEDFYLLGAVSNPYPYFAQTDIYIHATRFEGKSVAIQEAQTLGCAIIASNCSGNIEQIENEIDGILCELNAESIAESIIRFINHSELMKLCSEVAQKKKVNYFEDLNQLFEMVEN